MRQRIFVLCGIIITTLFFLALSGCGLAESVDQVDLQNATSGDGPGSGKWKPEKPANNRQARQLFNVLQTLSERGNETADEYDKAYILCFDENGKLRAEESLEECMPRLVELAYTWNRLFQDHESGSTVYDIWASETEGETPAPNPPDPPKDPKNPPPDTEDPEGDDDDDRWGCPPYCCLTCIHGMNVEYVFFPAPVRVEVPSS